MTWVEFADEAAFRQFHDAACKALGIPKPGENEGTGEVALDAQWTTGYVTPIDDRGTLKAQVDIDDVKTYGLTETQPPIWPVPGDTKTPAPRPAVFDIAKAVPSEPLDIAIVLVDRGIRTREQAAELLNVDPAELDRAVAALQIDIDMPVDVDPAVKGKG